MRVHYPLLVLLTAALFQPARADGTQTIWAVNGANCVPSDPTLQGMVYTIGSGSVKFAASATGTVTLYCAITYGATTPTSMDVTYIDSDGTGTDVQVDAQLFQVDLWTGAAHAVDPTPFHSSDNADTGVAHHSTTFVESGCAMAGCAFFVRVDLLRSSTSQTAQLYSISLSQ
jgi:hypothetical protein